MLNFSKFGEKKYGGRSMRIILIWSKIEGTSSSKGFVISNGEKSISTKNWRGRDEEPMPKQVEKTATAILKIGLVVSVALFLYLFRVPIAPDTLWSEHFCCLIWPFLSAVLYVILPSVYLAVIYCIAMAYKLRWQKKETREYHACEHMTIALLTSKRTLTLENLQKMSRASLGCSTTSHMILAIVPLALFTCVCVGWNNLLIGALGVVLPFVITLISWIVQLFVATASPSEKKMREAIEVAINFQ
jgi:uncharacterized protein YqhQ